MAAPLGLVGHPLLYEPVEISYDNDVFISITGRSDANLELVFLLQTHECRHY